MKLSSVFIAAPASEKDVKVASVSGTTKSLLSYSLKERRRREGAGGLCRRDANIMGDPIKVIKEQQ